MSGASPGRPRRRLLRGLAAGLAAVGLWQVGSGLYIPAKAALAQELLERAWDRTLAGDPDARPWPWADTRPVARLEVPGLGIDMIVQAGASGRVMAFGPGQMDGGAAIGERGVAVLAAHRDTHFSFLQHLSVGERFTLQTPDGRVRAYRVDGAAVTDYRDVRIRAAGRGTTIALVTCYPFDAIVPGGPLRYVVLAVEDAGVAEA